VADCPSGDGSSFGPGLSTAFRVSHSTPVSVTMAESSHRSCPHTGRSQEGDLWRSSIEAIFEPPRL
jgi:hypothetical protein